MADDDGPQDRSNWNAILKWSLAQQEPSQGGDSPTPPREISEEDRAWFLQAMSSGMIDEIKRMRDITTALASRAKETLDAEEVEARVELMEELVDRVGSIDNGGDMHTIGGLVPLVDTMAGSPHARLRAAAAEVLAATVQNHPKAQGNALDVGAMAPLLAMAAGRGEDARPAGSVPNEVNEASDEACAAARTGSANEALVQCRVKALFGLSCLLRGCARAQDAFKLGGGFELLRDCLRVDHPKVRRPLPRARRVMHPTSRNTPRRAIRTPSPPSVRVPGSSPFRLRLRPVREKTRLDAPDGSSRLVADV